MIGISKLYCGQVEPSDALRYGRHSSQLPSHLLQFSEDKKPVVVWNMTRRCNLKCVHCYAQAVDPDGKDEISTEQGKAIISDLAAYGAPVMLFSGGEPLVRQDLPELASYATEKGMRAVISTNGTLITKEKARELKAINLSYVGISLDGAEEIHDKFRGVPNSFKKALEGLENCKAEGLKVGLRFTINKRNVVEIPKVFKLLRELEVPRICFYHLVYSGRGIGCISWDGKVHADQFWRNHTFGNVLERPFSEIWDDPNIELLHKMKNKKAYVKGRCASCRFLNICGGNFRSRAEAYYGDEWAQDPACYLTDDEIRRPE